MTPAKLALIPPFSMMGDVSGGYCMYLPQLMKNPDYIDFVKRTNTSDAFTILDNGAFEGVRADSNELVRLATEMGVNEVAIPDVLRDMDETLNELDMFSSRTVEQRITTAVGLQYMAVPQGRTIQECMNCIDAMEAYPFVGTFGLAKHLVRTVTRTARVQLAAYIREKYGSRFNLHLLGASPLWPQEIKSARRYGIRGIDTSLPYFFAYYDRHVDGGMTEERPPNYFNLPRHSMSDILLDNVDTLWRWCND